jgi:hypothetical protein
MSDGDGREMEKFEKHLQVLQKEEEELAKLVNT